MDKYFMWIHYERLHNHNKAKHNKTVCIFLGIYCSSYIQFKESDGITYPLPNSNDANGAAVGVLKGKVTSRLILLDAWSFILAGIEVYTGQEMGPLGPMYDSHLRQQVASGFIC